MHLVCPATVPDIANGMVSSGDSAPFFINEIVKYQCNNNYDADGADLTNECMENAGDIVVPAVWSRMTADLISVCRAGRYSINCLVIYSLSMHVVIYFNTKFSSQFLLKFFLVKSGKDLSNHLQRFFSKANCNDVLGRS